MLPVILLASILVYLALLYYFSVWLGSNKHENASKMYLKGGKVKWWAVTIGMLGTTLSGVTFISVPGLVATTSKMSYFQFVLGNFVGMIVIAFLLLPLYYKISLYSIYTYIGNRFGNVSQKTAAQLFIVSRLIGSVFRLYLGCLVLQILVFDPLHIPFEANAILMASILWLYTRKGGIKALIWTDFAQTIILIGVAIYTFVALISYLDLSLNSLATQLVEHPQFQLFHFENLIGNGNHFIKQFAAGIFVTIALSGLDQDMMQKNLKLKTVQESQKNFISFGILFVIVNLFFLILGLVFVLFMEEKQMVIPEKTDTIYALLVQHYLGVVGIILFVVGVVAATFSSCASALVSITTSFLIDIKQVSPTSLLSKGRRKSIRATHAIVALLYILILVLFHALNNENVVTKVFKFAGYTYGPLLALFTAGLFFRIKPKDWTVPWISLLSILATIAIDTYSAQLLGGYTFGFEILLLNAALTLFGLVLFSQRKNALYATHIV